MPSAHNLESWNDAAPVPNSGGFAVVFWIESGAATLLGGEGTDLASAPDNRYDVAGLSATGALANVVIRVDAPGPITLRARIPACGTYPNGRWLDEVLLNPPVVITGQ